MAGMTCTHARDARGAAVGLIDARDNGLSDADALATLHASDIAIELRRRLAD
jgi:hypothetical protein